MQNNAHRPLIGRNRLAVLVIGILLAHASGYVFWVTVPAAIDSAVRGPTRVVELDTPLNFYTRDNLSTPVAILNPGMKLRVRGKRSASWATLSWMINPQLDYKNLPLRADESMVLTPEEALSSACGCGDSGFQNHLEEPARTDED